MQTQAQILDSLHQAFSQKPKLFFQLDGYNTFASGNKANAFGFKTGVDFGKKIRLGIGYSWLSTDIVESRFIAAEYDTFRTEIKSAYVTMGAEYVMLRSDPWQVTFPMHFGFGNSYRIYPKNGKDLKTDKHSVVLLEPAITGHYKFIKWVGVGFGFGYRIMLKNNEAVDQKISGPLYVLRLKLFLNEIYKTVFPKKENQKKK